MNEGGNFLLGRAEPAALVIRVRLPKTASTVKSPRMLAEGALSGKFRQDGVLAEIMEENGENTRIFFVQYNPSKLRLTGEVEVEQQVKIDDSKKEEINGKKIEELEVKDVISTAYQPAKMILETTLVFDHTNIARAFTNDNYSLNPLNLAKTISGMSASDSEMDINGLTVSDRNIPTVQTEIEAILSMLQNEYIQEIQFVWGKYCFSGVLQSVRTAYTMFDKKGRPIRGQIVIRLLQSETCVTIANWYEDLEELLNDDSYTGNMIPLKKL